VLTHGGQYWWTRAVQRYWPGSPDQRALAAVPLYHKNAMAGAIKPMLHIGGSVVLLPNFEPRRFLKVLADYRCTQAGAVPAVFTLLLQQRDLIDSLDFSALQALKLGSAPVQEELMTAVKQAFGCSIGESYGLTEGGPVMIGPPLDDREVPFGSCGVAWPEGEVKLVTANGEASASDGELWVRNPGVTPGYHNLPEVNAKRLKDGWLATGDLFHRDADGFFFFLGRTDDMFNSGGENIYPKEVENLLIGHPSVFDASVVPVAHPIKGHVPVAMVMLEEGVQADETALKQHCLDNGPAYAHPRRIQIVAEMPLNGAGKVDRTVVEDILTDAFEATIDQKGAV
jgi:long-chain acyl-CoA synthetase